MFKKIGYALMLATVMLAVVVAPVLALPPDRVVVTDEPYGPDPLLDCGDYTEYDHEIWVKGINSTIQHTFYNRDGSIDRMLINLIGEDTFFNPETGKEVSGSWSVNVTLLPDNTHIVNGLLTHITIPGLGVVFFDAGKLIWNAETEEIIFLAGPKMSFGEFEKICSVLAE